MFAGKGRDQGLLIGQASDDLWKEVRLFEFKVRFKGLCKKYSHTVYLRLPVSWPCRTWRLQTAEDESLREDEYVVMVMRQRNQGRVSLHVGTIQCAFRRRPHHVWFPDLVEGVQSLDTARDALPACRGNISLPKTSQRSRDHGPLNLLPF